MHFIFFFSSYKYTTSSIRKKRTFQNCIVNQHATAVRGRRSVWPFGILMLFSYRDWLPPLMKRYNSLTWGIVNTLEVFFPSWFRDTTGKKTWKLCRINDCARYVNSLTVQVYIGYITAATTVVYVHDDEVLVRHFYLRLQSAFSVTLSISTLHSTLMNINAQ